MPFDPVGALAAHPGGRELSALVARAQRVDPEVLRGVGRGLAAMAEGIDGSLRSLGRHGDDVRAAWQGRGAEALTGYLDDVGRAGAGTLDAAGRIRARVDGAARELAAMRREVDVQVSRALDAARRAEAEALADPVRAPIADQLAAQAMTGPTAAARAAVARAETMLGDAAAALRELAGDLTAFSRLPTPDARALSGAAPAATVPAFNASSVDGAQGIDISDRADGPGDFTDTSSLDSASGDGCGDDSGDVSVSEASDEDEFLTGTSADLDGGDAGAGAGGGDDGSFTGTSADLDDADASDSDDASVSDAGDASVSEASDVGDPVADDDATDDDPDAEQSEAEQSDADESDADESDADESDADESDAESGASDRDSGDRDRDRDRESGAVTSASTGSGETAAPDSGDAAPTGGPAGEVGDWIREAMAILRSEGVPVDKMDPDDIATIIEHESGGDPEAINNWDSNADKGTPSQGLMQTIGPTFDSYKLDGHGEITAPVDNIIAGVRYAIARYGSVSEVPGVEAVARGDSYVGY